MNPCLRFKQHLSHKVRNINTIYTNLCGLFALTSGSLVGRFNSRADLTHVVRAKPVTVVNFMELASGHQLMPLSHEL